jgi:hypothetical protein
MPTSRILTPTLLDAPVPGLDRVADRGGWTLNAPPLPDGDEMTRTGVVLAALADLVEGAARTGQRPIALGGDCCHPIAVMAGLTRAGVRPLLSGWTRTATSTPTTRRSAASSAACRWRC